MASEPFSGFGGVLGRPGAVPGVLASWRHLVSVADCLTASINRLACMAAATMAAEVISQSSRGKRRRRRTEQARSRGQRERPEGIGGGELG